MILWKKRYAAEGTGGLEDRPRPGKPRTTDDVAIVLATLEPPPKRLGVTHWSSRLLAAELGISNVKVADVWREWGLQPWRAESFKFSTDPRLEARVRDVTGLYLNPPRHGERGAVVVGTHRDPPGAGRNVVDPVRGDLAQLLVDEVVHIHRLLQALGLPFPAAVPELADVLLLGVHADHRVAGGQVCGGLVVEVGELGVPVRALVLPRSPWR